MKPPGRALLASRRAWLSQAGAGRGWALPPGTCYQVAGDPLPPWFDWPESWFPKEGFFFRHFGTALSLPIPAP